MNSALFPCLCYSLRLLPKESLWPLVHCHWEGLGQLKVQWPQSPHLVLLHCSLLMEAESARLRGLHSHSPHSAYHAPWGPGVFFQDCVSFFPRADLPRADCISKTYTLQPQEGHGSAAELGYSGWHMQMHVHRAPRSKTELEIERKGNALWAG